MVGSTVVGEDGRLPLPWLEPPLQQALAAGRSHAMLLRCSPGGGALALALTLAQSLLCDAATPESTHRWACGRCAGCKLVLAQAHPDLFVLLPEQERRSSGWLLRDDKAEGDDAREGKRKASRQIRIDDVRGLLDWVTKTSARGRGKLVVLHPAEALNAHAASALLKTVEEPPAGTRMVLTCSDAQHLLPTVRSRCQIFEVPAPQPADAHRWLAEQGVPQPGALLAACDGQPLDALAWHQRGVDAARWAALPAELSAGRAGMLSGSTVADAVEVLLKVCHDAMAVAVGGPARYLPGARFACGLALPALSRWHAELLEVARAAEHPWHEALAVEALVAGARRALRGADPAAHRAHPAGP
ncbi:MAG: DNA polymerase III subunit delta' [Rubrivivax sp.]|nr:DNA polymerase III subunit delta' [Rubrivivax sp.]